MRNSVFSAHFVQRVERIGGAGLETSALSSSDLGVLEKDNGESSLGQRNSTKRLKRLSRVSACALASKRPRELESGDSRKSGGKSPQTVRVSRGRNHCCHGGSGS